jgi:GT2 family glycosyltransferase
MDLSIIIPSFNTKDLLQACLQSVFQQTKGIDFEVIVVDNHSTDGSPEMVKKKFPQVILIKNKTNLGFAQANNQGMKRAKGEYFLLLNSDTKIKSNALKKLVSLAKKKKDLGIAGSRLLNLNDTPQPSTGPFYTLPLTFISLFRGDHYLRQSPSQTKKVDWLMGACFLIKREVTKKVGYLDEKFFMYVEEMEYCYRAHKAGFGVYFFPRAEVYHLERGSSPEGKQKAVWGIYQGLIYFYQKHFAPWQLAVLKLLLRTKALIAWLLGLMTGNRYLKETYAKAFQLVG